MASRLRVYNVKYGRSITDHVTSVKRGTYKRGDTLKYVLIPE